VPANYQLAIQQVSNLRYVSGNGDSESHAYSLI